MPRSGPTFVRPQSASPSGRVQTITMYRQTADQRNASVGPTREVKVPLVGKRIVDAQPAVRSHPNAAFKELDVEDEVSRQSAVDLVESIESPTRESDQSGSPGSEPKRAGRRVVGQSGDVPTSECVDLRLVALLRREAGQPSVCPNPHCPVPHAHGADPVPRQTSDHVESALGRR